MPKPLEVQYLTIHGHERAFVKTGQGPALLLLHGLGCDHTTWLPVIAALSRRYTVIAPDLLGHGAVRQAAGRLQRRRLRQRHARPADRARHRQGDRRRAQLRRRRRDAVRLPVPRAHRADGPGRARRPRPRGDAGDPGDHAAGLPPGDGRGRPCPASATSTTAGLRALAAPGLPQARDLDEVAEISTRSRTRTPGAAIRHVVSRRVDWRGQIVTMVDRAYLTQAMPMCVIWGTEDAVIPVKHAENAADSRPARPSR